MKPGWYALDGEELIYLGPCHSQSFGRKFWEKNKVAYLKSILTNKGEDIWYKLVENSDPVRMKEPPLQVQMMKLIGVI